MMEAATNNRKAMCKVLDSFGADVNLADGRGLTALHLCYLYGYEALGLYLVAKLGADDSRLDARGRSCFDMARPENRLKSP